MVLTTEPAGGMLSVRSPAGVSVATPSKEYNRTNLVLIHFPVLRPQGGLAIGRVRAHPGQNAFHQGLVRAGSKLNRVSGHVGAGRQARMAIRCGKW